jgi:hypothetical protein
MTIFSRRSRSEIAASDFPEADILIVGDHMPPYFDRHHRTQFDRRKGPMAVSAPQACAPSQMNLIGKFVTQN